AARRGGPRRHLRRSAAVAPRELPRRRRRLRGGARPARGLWRERQSPVARTAGRRAGDAAGRAGPRRLRRPAASAGPWSGRRLLRWRPRHRWWADCRGRRVTPLDAAAAHPLLPTFALIGLVYLTCLGGILAAKLAWRGRSSYWLAVLGGVFFLIGTLWGRGYLSGRATLPVG